MEKIVLKTATQERIKQLVGQMQMMQSQYGEAISSIIATVCEENDVDLKKQKPVISNDLTTISFQDIVSENDDTHLSVVEDGN